MNDRHARTSVATRSGLGTAFGAAVAAAARNSPWRRWCFYGVGNGCGSAVVWCHVAIEWHGAMQQPCGPDLIPQLSTAPVPHPSNPHLLQLCAAAASSCSSSTVTWTASSDTAGAQRLIGGGGGAATRMRKLRRWRCGARGALAKRCAINRTTCHRGACGDPESRPRHQNP